MAKQLSSEGDGEVCGIATFFFLHFTGENKHLGSRMLNFELSGKVSTSLRMVAASEVTKVLSIWFTTIFLRAE
jgi:hypothetical protein